MINFTLRQIEIFLTVAKTLSMSKAAQKLNMTQAAVSMAIAELEKFLSEKLFDRSGNKLYLNENGRSFICQAERMYDMAKEIQDRKALKTIKISASSTIGNYVLPSILGKYLKINSDTHFLLTVKNSEEVLAEILNFEADIGFIEGYCSSRSIKSEVFASDNLYIFCSPTSPLSTRKNVTTDELLNHRWILREKGSGTREVIEHALGDKLSKMNVYMELGHSEAIKNAVLSNMGISCLSEYVLKSYIDFGMIKIVDTPINPIKRDLYMISHKDKFIGNTLEKFISYIKS